MKKIMFMALWQLVIIAVYGQNTSPASTVQTDYLKKSRGQNTAAWFMVSGGATLVLVGGIIDLNNLFVAEPEKSSSAGTVLGVTGLATMFGSIPFFIAASKNKRKANSIAAIFKIEQQPSVSKGIVIRTPYPAIAVKISL